MQVLNVVDSLQGPGIRGGIPGRFMHPKTSMRNDPLAALEKNKDKFSAGGINLLILRLQIK